MLTVFGTDFDDLAKFFTVYAKYLPHFSRPRLEYDFGISIWAQLWA